MSDQARQSGHRWVQITDLPSDLRDHASTELDALLSKWQSQLASLGDSNLVSDFNHRLIREWSIETGILERLYSIDEGVTLTLIEQGFDSAFLSSGDSDIGSEQLMQVLGDHKDVAEGLFVFVNNRRELSTSYIKEMHAVLTAHQSTCEAVDSMGISRNVPLLRGEYNTQPNNPGDPRTGETRHEYCPPEHVAAEMERLLDFHCNHGNVAFVVEAAWLHHRFTQIHPFQDGNGRVARALATLVCLRAGSLPVVVTRADKVPYIHALEQADGGDLLPLVELFRRLQKHRLLKALSLTEEAAASALDVDQIIASAKEKIDLAGSHRAWALQKRAEKLHRIAFDRYSSVAAKLTEAGFAARPYTCNENNDFYFRQQIVSIAKHVGYYANLRGPKFWAHLRIGVGATFHIVVSIHHLGRIEDGVMVSSAFSFHRNVDQEGPSRDVSELTPDFLEGPFTFTADRDEEEVTSGFEEWTGACLQIALAKWQKSL